MYRLGREVGRGALGRVVLLHAPDGTVQAGKILHASHRNDPRALHRFRSEARILADVRHPNLVLVHGLTEVDGEEVLRMEVVAGGSLGDLIAREAPLAAERVVSIGRGIAAGLAAAHHAGLVHRDLKPHNVLLDTTGQPKIVDFGLARAASFAGVDRDAFAVAGTPDYMAPEALDPLAVDARSDLYALGCILYEMVAGRPPFAGATPFAILEAHRDATLPVPPTPSRGLARLIQWLLAKSPADRPQSATAVERAFDDLEGPGTALATVEERGAGECPACGATSVPGVAVCFGCGQAQVMLSAGPCSVFVVGPGGHTHKLDARLRQRLLDWLRANPGIGLDPAPLEKAAPRLPFLVVAGVDETSATGLAAALGALGFECERLEHGSRFSLASMRRKAVALSGRVAMLLVGSSYLFIQLGKALPFVALVGTVAAGTVGGGIYLAGRPAVKRRLGKSAGPALLAAPLERVTGIVPTIAEARHRESLRGVVQRALALHAAIPDQAAATRLEPELAALIDVAVVAASRLDEIDATLAATDLRNPTDEARTLMQERDGCAARLLETAAFLDALRARYAASTVAAGDEESLAELRAMIEALEEVQRS